MKNILVILVFLSGQISYAQQFLNLDFEKLSIDPPKPWGWSYEPMQNSIVELDSSIKTSGRYSLHIRQAGGFQRINMAVELYELRGKKIRFTSYALVHSGNIRMGVSYIMKGDTIRHTRSSHQSGRWGKTSVILNIPKQVEHLWLIFETEGESNCWVDGASLEVNGKMVQSVNIAPGLKEEAINWLAAHSYPIKNISLTSEDTDEAASNVFGNVVRDAHLVALGEATHGTSEFFKLKGKLIRHCVEKLGFRAFALEDNQLVVERVNSYVLYGFGTARGSMYGLFSVWQNQEMLDLIKWMRDYNIAHPDDKVVFMGYDIQNPSQAIDSTIKYLVQKDPVLFEQEQPFLNELKSNWKNSFSVEDSIRLRWMQRSKILLDKVLAKRGAWLYNVGSYTDSLKIEWIAQYVRLIKQFSENAFKGHMSLYRDEAMAENIIWITQICKPGSKVMIWAHDNHVSRGDHPSKELNYYNGISMGAHLSRLYKQAYKAFGMFTYSGNYWAQIAYTNFKQLPCPLYPSPKGSLDEALHGIAVKKNTNAVLLDLSNARKQNWFVKPIPVRFANHVCMEYQYWTQFSIPYQFDGLFFFDKSHSAARPSNQ